MAYYRECLAEIFVCEPKTALLAELRRRLPLGQWRITPLSSLPKRDVFPARQPQLLLVDFRIGPAIVLDWISQNSPESLQATWILLDESTQDLAWHLRDFGLRPLSEKDLQSGHLIEACLHWAHTQSPLPQGSPPTAFGEKSAQITLK